MSRVDEERQRIGRYWRILEKGLQSVRLLGYFWKGVVIRDFLGFQGIPQ
jgi:hypothetical protein